MRKGDVFLGGKLADQIGANQDPHLGFDFLETGEELRVDLALLVIGQGVIGRPGLLDGVFIA